jgi:hypothetical protein
MTQRTLGLTKYTQNQRTLPEEAEAVGLSADDDVVTLRFIGQVKWGESAARQVRLDRKLAEQLTRLLNDELDTYTWEI